MISLIRLGIDDRRNLSRLRIEIDKPVRHGEHESPVFAEGQCANRLADIKRRVGALFRIKDKNCPGGEISPIQFALPFIPDRTFAANDRRMIDQLGRSRFNFWRTTHSSSLNSSIMSSVNWTPMPGVSGSVNTPSRTLQAVLSRRFRKGDSYASAGTCSIYGVTGEYAARWMLAAPRICVDQLPGITNPPASFTTSTTRFASVIPPTVFIYG